MTAHRATVEYQPDGTWRWTCTTCQAQATYSANLLGIDQVREHARQHETTANQVPGVGVERGTG